MKERCLRQRTSAFTLIEIMIVVGIIGLLVAIALPNFMHSRDTTRLNAIYDNLRVVEGAKEQWAIQTHQTNGATPDMLTLSNYFLHGVQPVMSEVYVPNQVGTAAVAQLPPGIRLPPYGPGDTIPAR